MRQEELIVGVRVMPHSTITEICSSGRMREVSTTLVKRSFKYRFYPTEAQKVDLWRTFGCVRLVYNMALEARVAMWSQERRQLSYGETSAMLTAWKHEERFAFLNNVSCVPLQQTLRHLQGAFTNFYSKRARHPRFKSRKRSHAAAEYTRSAFRWRNGVLSLAKMPEPLAIAWSRPLPEGVQPSTVTVSADSAGRWFVSILVEHLIDHHPPATTAIGLDAGITTLMTLSTGEKIHNPRHGQKEERRLARAQRVLSRRSPGSANRLKARRKVARVHARIADRRQDFLHKLTTRLVRENQTIVLEDLHVSGMLRNRRLARAISDASWSRLRDMLEHKAAWYGREVVVVDRWFPSSKTCSACGLRTESLPLGVRTWTCRCGATHDRDVNAALNILAAGLAVAACGDGVRPNRRQLARQPSQPPSKGEEAGTVGREPDGDPLSRTGEEVKLLLF